MFTPTAADVRLTSLLRSETIRPLLPPGPDAASVVTALRPFHARIESTLDEQALHAVVSDYIARAKSDGCLIEHAIVRLKRAIEDAGLSADSGPRAALNRDVITRCIREYYRR
jgi:hypothetical protein